MLDFHEPAVPKRTFLNPPPLVITFPAIYTLHQKSLP